MAGLKRHCEKKLRELLKKFPALVILGVRQCGKTHLSKVIRPKWKYFDLENSKDREFIERDFDFFFQEYSKNIILDEAQEVPALFKNLRGVIDSSRKTNNRFLITGSSSPELIERASDSLAGRAAFVELGTFKISEIKKRTLSPFFDIFNSPLKKSSLDFLKQVLSKRKTFDVIPLILKGGYPDPCLSGKRNYFNLWMKNYFDTYVHRDIRKLYPRLNILRFQRFISMLSELSGTVINKAQVGRALDLSEVTVKDYLDIADKTFLWQQIPGFSSSKKRSLVKMPKGFLRDSGLINYLSDIKGREPLLRSPKLGQIFESFVIEEIIKGLNISSFGRWNYSHYRTKNGMEIDLILEGDFGLLPVEIKFSTSVNHRSLMSLKKFIKEYNLPFGVLVTHSQEVKMLSENIIQIPASLI